MFRLLIITDTKRNAHETERDQDFENDPSRKIEQSIYELGNDKVLLDSMSNTRYLYMLLRLLLFTIDKED